VRKWIIIHVIWYTKDIFNGLTFMPQSTEFFPFHAINEFMRPDFRLTVIREVLLNQEILPDSFILDLTQKLKKRVSIPGFRNSDKAPAMVKILPSAKAFEEYPDFTASILNCWSEISKTLRDQVYQTLKTRQWKMLSITENIESENFCLETLTDWPVLPLNFNRPRLPGFYTHWPAGEDFEALYKCYTELYKEADIGIDKVSLMVVWLSMRLPYHVDANINTTEEQNGTNS
jgi:hypothetical protein